MILLNFNSKGSAQHKYSLQYIPCMDESCGGVVEADPLIHYRKVWHEQFKHGEVYKIVIKVENGPENQHHMNNIALQCKKGVSKLK